MARCFWSSERSAKVGIAAAPATPVLGMVPVLVGVDAGVLATDRKIGGLSTVGRIILGPGFPPGGTVPGGTGGRCPAGGVSDMMTCCRGNLLEVGLYLSGDLSDGAVDDRTKAIRRC